MSNGHDYLSALYRHARAAWESGDILAAEALESEIATEEARQDAVNDEREDR